jgi:hypothetical protein
MEGNDTLLNSNYMFINFEISLGCQIKKYLLNNRVKTSLLNMEIFLDFFWIKFLLKEYFEKIFVYIDV